MPALWYAILASMLTAWAVLDGFDFGAGIVHLALAKKEDDRRAILAAIGPVWDGNEVWLIAGGGVFVFAFPRAYAVAFSGLYLAMMLVLWLLALRGVAIELRGRTANLLWRAAWDAVFALASTVMALVAGVALGIVIRGVPIGPSGWFHLDLFAWHDGGTGAIDGYTGLVGITSVVLLGAHGATYLAWKTDGELHERTLGAARRAWFMALVLLVGATVATALVRPSLFVQLAHRPWAWPLPLIALASAFLVVRELRRPRELRAFLASCALIASILVGTAAGLYPAFFPSTVDPAYTLDAYSAASGEHGLMMGMIWVFPALALATAYFVHIFRTWRGKVRLDDYGH